MNGKANPPIVGNNDLEISSKLLENPQEGQSAAKPLKEDNNYLIYPDGRVYSLKTKRFLTGKVDNVGYQVYFLLILNPLTSKMGKMFYAHRLVAEYYLDNPDDLPYVHHKDGNKLNNNVDNLEWVSAQTNYIEYIKSKGRLPYAPPDKKTDLSGEEWKIVKENPLYSVSNYGRVVNNKTNNLLKIDTSQKYCRVCFNDKKHYYLHRLVYCTFWNDYDLEGYVIDHIDNNPKNNDLSNLLKLTSSENNYKRFSKEGSTTNSLRELD